MVEDIVKTNDGGQIELRQFGGNVEYAIYVPPDVNPDTPIFTYVYGSGRKSGWYSKNGPYDSLIQNGGNSIVIMPSMNWNEDWGKNTMEIVNSVRNEYGITNTNLSGGGFSYGGDGGFSVVAENLRQNGASNLDPQIVYLIDDYSNKTYKEYNATLNSEDINLFKENNTIFLTYENKNSVATEAFAKAGLNIIRVKCDDGSHTGIKTNFFKNGIYDYMAGDSLPLEGYTYQKAVVTVDSETGKQIVNWENIDVNEINTKEKLYSYYGLEAKSDLNSESSDTFFEKLFDFFGEKVSVLKNFTSDGHQLSVKPNDVNDVCSQLDDMAKAINDAYQAVTDYAASSTYPVSVPVSFDKSAAISAITRATQVCNDSATQVYNVADIISRYSNGDWSISSDVLSHLGDFIGFVSGGSSSKNCLRSKVMKTSVDEDEKENTDSDRFKFL